jgi:hypothetical protein
MLDPAEALIVLIASDHQHLKQRCAIGNSTVQLSQLLLDYVELARHF